nr:MAG TPA: resistance protein [Caudoviricetes sp.]
MNNLNLYEITNAFPALMENEEISEENKKQIEEELTLLLQQKSQNIIGYIRNMELTAEAMKNEEKRISERRKQIENHIVRFKEYVKDCMENNGILKIETGLGTLSTAKSPISVEIINESVIPDEYKTEVVTIKVDKKKIADNFKATGELIDGVIIHTDNTNLRIK